jgi:hypothetical protein
VAEGVVVLRNPITGIAACCERAASGHAAATADKRYELAASHVWKRPRSSACPRMILR